MVPDEQTGKVINETLEISPAKLPADCAKATGPINEAIANAAKIFMFIFLPDLKFGRSEIQLLGFGWDMLPRLGLAWLLAGRPFLGQVRNLFREPL